MSLHKEGDVIVFKIKKAGIEGMCDGCFFEDAECQTCPIQITHKISGDDLILVECSEYLIEGDKNV